MIDRHPIPIGAEAPDFELPADSGAPWRLSDQRGAVTVLLFYPQDETLVCTRQLCSVRDNWEHYLATRAVIVGISPGSPDQHREFSSNRRLPIPLLADAGREVTTSYTRHWLYPTSFTRGVVVIDANGIVRSVDVMLRAFRPLDEKLIADIYAARGDAFSEQYDQLRAKARAALRS